MTWVISIIAFCLLPIAEAGDGGTYGASLLQIDSFGRSRMTPAHINTSSQLAATADGDLNFCKSGRLRPELFVLGFQKSGTTDFCRKFREVNPKVNLAANIEDEENKWWDKEPTIFNSAERFNRGEEFWLQHYPECQQNSRQVAVDCTPYLGIGWDPLGIPRRIQERYGLLFSNLTFVVLMREPVARMHSAFYYDRERKFPEHYSKFESFQSYVDNLLTEGSDLGSIYNKGGYRESIYDVTDYATHLQNLLLEPGLRPEQLFILPMKLMIDSPTNISASEMVAIRLGIQESHNESTLSALSQKAFRNPSKHPALEEDLSASTLIAIREQLNGSKSVASVLASHGIGATLYGYSGPPGDEVAISNWLKRGW